MSKKYRLKDIKVKTVGLVDKGANRRNFFMLKSDEADAETLQDASPEEQPEETNMSETKANPEAAEELTLAQEELSVLQKFAKALGFLAEDEPKDEPTTAQVDTSEFEKKYSDLRKQQDELTAQLAKAKEEAELEKDARVREQLMAKIEKDMGHIPGHGEDEFGEKLFELRKADSDLANWVETKLTAVNEVLKDSEQFKENGNSGNPEETANILEKAEALMKAEGGPENLKDALLSLDKKDQLGYVADQRKQVAKGA